MTILESIGIMKQNDDAFIRMAATLMEKAVNSETFDQNDIDDEDLTETEMQEEFSKLAQEIKTLKNTVLLGALEYISGVEVWDKFEN